MDGVADMSILFEAKDPYGDRRFYPPGEHPATHHLRQMRRRLEELQVRGGGGTIDGLKALLEVERQLKQFEDGEWRAKLTYLERKIK